MLQKEFQENWEIFSKLIDNLPTAHQEQMQVLIKRYIEQNLLILNDVFSISIENLHRLQKAQVPNDVICTQARFTNEISKKTFIIRTTVFECLIRTHR